MSDKFDSTLMRNCSHVTFCVNLSDRFVDILRGGDLLLHPGAEDEHVEGGAGLGQPPHIHLCPLVPGGHGGAPDSSRRAEETQP